MSARLKDHLSLLRLLVGYCIKLTIVHLLKHTTLDQVISFPLHDATARLRLTQKRQHHSRHNFTIHNAQCTYAHSSRRRTGA